MGQFEGLQDFDVAALGRNASASTGKPRDLPVARIERDPDNIRKSFDEAAVIQLAETIKADGLLQAITVRRNPHKKDYFIISYGERRFRAVCLLGHPTIAAVIDDNFESPSSSNRELAARRTRPPRHCRLGGETGGRRRLAHHDRQAPW